jgi:hypothetical protein
MQNEGEAIRCGRRSELRVAAKRWRDAPTRFAVR